MYVTVWPTAQTAACAFGFSLWPGEERVRQWLLAFYSQSLGKPGLVPDHQKPKGPCFTLPLTLHLPGAGGLVFDFSVQLLSAPSLGRAVVFG